MRKRVAAYCRVSTKEELQQYSLEAQQNYYKDLIESNPDFIFVGIYADTIVSPMLSRIGKCRTLIKKSTDGKLDVLDSKQFSGYKRYFGDY